MEADPADGEVRAELERGRDAEWLKWQKREVGKLFIWEGTTGNLYLCLFAKGPPCNNQQSLS